MTRLRRWVAAALRPTVGWAAGVVVLTWIAVGLHLQDQRAHALALARENGAILARAFSESLLREVRDIDQTLLLVRTLRERAGPSADLAPWIDQVDRLHAPALRILLTDRAGLVTLSNLQPITRRIDLSDRAYFRRFADHPEDVLEVGPPVADRGAGQTTVQFARMLRDQRGGFDGVLVAGVQPVSLLRFAAPAGFAPHGTVTLFGLDGVPRARIADGGMTERAAVAATSPAARRAAAAAEGAFTWTDPADGVRWLESFRRVPGLPLLVSVGQSEDAVLADYRRDLPRLTVAEAAMTLLALALAIAGACERQRRAATQTALERALASISQGIAMATPEGRLLVLNRRARDLLGLPAQFAPGCQVADIIHWEVAHNAFGPGMPAPAELFEIPSVHKRVRPNGTVLEVRSHALDDGCMVRTFSDVTEWEHTQQALQHAREAAEAATRARSQFLAVMSHEIRTPLNGILGIAELLDDTGLTAEQERYARTIRESGGHLLAMLNDVLDFSKIENGTVELECAPFAPRGVLEMVRAMLAQQATEQGLRLRIEAAPSLPERVLGDPRRLRQVLLNLVGNAVKFTRAGAVEVNLSATGTASGWRLDGEVRDTGIGIEPDMMARLFCEFSQIDGSITRRFGGAGLGLAICRRLLEAMGGSISAESRPGAGSTFRFSLLVGAAPSEAAPRCLHAATRGPLRVLLAEDNQVNQLVATRILERAGHAVLAVEDGAAALAAARRGGFDLVLMDVMMPVMDGLAATRAIRALPGAAGQVKVIGLTARVSSEDKAACRAAGMDGFAPKPITPERLTAEIDRVCGLAAGPSGPPALSAQAPAETIDPAVLAELEAALGPGSAAEIAASFLADAPARLDRMRALAASGAAEQLAREAHALAGSAGTLGLRGLAAAARSLELGLATATATADLPACLAPLEALAESAIAWLKPQAMRPAA